MEENFFQKFKITRHLMVPRFNESATIPILDNAEAGLVEKFVYEDRDHWEGLIQEGNYKLTADTAKYSLLYENLTRELSEHLSCTVKLKTPLDFFLFDKFDSKWEKEPSGFIHTDWANYAKCMREFATHEDIQNYDPTHAVALVLAITLPEIGSGIELYDAFAGEHIAGKDLLRQRKEREYSLRTYKTGHATLFCPFQFHSGHCADEGTLKDTDSRIVLVAFLVKYKRDDVEEWHMFRMCKGATLEYGDETLYGLPEDILVKNT